MVLFAKKQMLFLLIVRNIYLKIGIFHLFRRPFRFFNFLFFYFISFPNNKTNVSKVISINLEINLILRALFKPIRTQNKIMRSNEQTWIESNSFWKYFVISQSILNRMCSLKGLLLNLIKFFEMNLKLKFKLYFLLR
jgi:hypothetical protein